LNGVKEFIGDEGEGLKNAVPIPEGTLSEEQSQKSLAVYLQDIALLTDADSNKTEDMNKVSLMTVHAAKGLEFPYVFIVGMEENLFPSQLALNSRSDLEEERRLFYVALTRAEKEVHISHSASRYRWGNVIYCEPSRFIEEIDPKYLEYDQVQEETTTFEKDRSNYFRSTKPTQRANIKSTKSNGMSMTKKKNSQKSQKKVIPPFKKMVSVDDANREVDPSFVSTAQKIKEGMRVDHRRFGKGIVNKIEGEEPNRKATIEFEKLGEKQLLLKFAKLRILRD